MSEPELRELDAKVAAEILGWTKLKAPSIDHPSLSWQGQTPSGRGDWIPHYSSEVGLAFRVVEHLREQGAHWRIFSAAEGCWIVHAEGNYGEVRATLPLAVCYAALGWQERRLSAEREG